MPMVELSEEDQKLLERAKILKALLERVREKNPHHEPFNQELGEALAWIAWAALHDETVDFAEPDNDGEISDDLQENWADTLKYAFPDREDPVWQFVNFDAFDDPFRDEKFEDQIAEEDAEGSEPLGYGPPRRTLGGVASQEERNARLDALAASVNDWADRRKRELETRVESAKAILNGRGGADRLANSTSRVASALVVQEVDDFLLGS